MDTSEISTPVLNTYQALVSAFCEFITVAVHTILYERDIYPRTSFITARKYNFAVRQSRHPAVCQWILDAVANVEVELLKCNVSQVMIIIYSRTTNIPLERFVFSTEDFPIVPSTDANTSFENPSLRTPTDEITSPLSTTPSPPHSPAASPSRAPPATRATPLVDLTTQFPAVLARLCMLSASLGSLPDDCTFTIAIGLRDQPLGEAPIGNSMSMVPAEPGLQKTESKKPESEYDCIMMPSIGTKKGQHLGGVRTTLVRSVEAGPFLMEVWIEEGKEKVEFGVSMRETQSGKGKSPAVGLEEADR